MIAWTRRAWLSRTAGFIPTAMFGLNVPWHHTVRSTPRIHSNVANRVARQALPLEPGPAQALVNLAVETARDAGAKYADARVTRTVRQIFSVGDEREKPKLWIDSDEVGVGVRVLVDGYWGFAASAVRTSDEAVRLAREAVEQARQNAHGPSRPMEWETVPRVTGTWTTPIKIDPFTISIEEKLDVINSWFVCANRAGCEIAENYTPVNFLASERQERVLATSDGSLVTQTVYLSSGVLHVKLGGSGTTLPGGAPTFSLPQMEATGAGWEHFAEIDIEHECVRGADVLRQRLVAGTKPSTVGRYTLVVDGRTMASILSKTLGVATQLDRALGYEANASGTSFLNDPLAMVGNTHVATPLVTITANRSAPRQLATVKWDEEGVEPQPFTLVQDGVLTDFQTTREQAAWLAPYYQRLGRPVRSHGCAAAEDGHYITMQHMPNLDLTPSPSSTSVADLVGNVTDGILIEDGVVSAMDFQAKHGLLWGDMRRIQNGRVGSVIQGGAILFNTQEFWSRILALGGASTQQIRSDARWGAGGVRDVQKGEPPQFAPRSVRAVAATIPNQPLIDPTRRA